MTAVHAILLAIRGPAIGRTADRLYLAHLAIVLCGIAALLGEGAEFALGLALLMVMVGWQVLIAHDYIGHARHASASSVEIVGGNALAAAAAWSRLLRALTRAGCAPGAPPCAETVFYSNLSAKVEARALPLFAFPQIGSVGRECPTRPLCGYLDKGA